MNERYIKRYTPWLGREFEMNVFGNAAVLFVGPVTSLFQ